MLAAASSAIRAVLRGPRRSFHVLGAVAAALYVCSDADVVAVVRLDAVRLPCAVVLPDRVDLRDLVPDGDVTVGDRAVRWTSRGRPVVIEVVREWQPARVRAVTPWPDRLAELGDGVARIDIGVSVTDPLAVVGLGPGLTPSGDDVLAGYLLGCRAFGLPLPALPNLSRTTVLSAALVRHAASGECIPQVAAVIAGLGSAVPLDPTPVLGVGHTSGAAVARGVLLASGHFRANCPLAVVAS